MNKIVVVIFFLISFSVIHAQDIQKSESDTVRIDSIKASSIKEKAENVIGTIFKPEPGLNNADSIVKAFDNLPSFGIYKNNYIVTGTAVNHKPGRDNSDAKFQISVMQKLTNSVLPFRTYLFLTYSQLAFWDIYKESFPFSDINFNPSIGLGRVLIYKNRFVGTLMFQLEHESNGKAEEDSRSWNKASLGTVLIINRHWHFQAKAWIPIVDGQNNRNIACYKGWSHYGLDYNNHRLNVGLLFTSRAGGAFNGNITVNFSYRLFKAENQHLFVEYYNGYGENLLFYKQFRQRLRVGFVIQPGFMRIY